MPKLKITTKEDAISFLNDFRYSNVKLIKKDSESIECSTDFIVNDTFTCNNFIVKIKSDSRLARIFLLATEN